MISIICDDSDVFVLIVFFYWKLMLKNKVIMDSTNENRTVIDIGDTVTNNLDIFLYLVEARALSECDTAAPYHGSEN